MVKSQVTAHFTVVFQLFMQILILCPAVVNMFQLQNLLTLSLFAQCLLNGPLRVHYVLSRLVRLVKCKHLTFLSEVPLSYLCICLFFRCLYTSVGAVCLPAQLAMPVITQLLRGLPRNKILASSLLPCQQHQSQLAPTSPRPGSRRPSVVCLNQHLRSYQTTSVLCSYILTPPQVNSILKANEYSFKVCGVIHENTLTITRSFYLTICVHFGSRCQSLMGRMCHQ